MPNIFSGCLRLTSITVANKNPKYDSRYDCNAIIDSISNVLVAGCKNTIIPENVEGIGACAFAECSGLKSIHIPGSVKSIGKWAFTGCTGLTSIHLPASVESVEYSAFDECTGLETIYIKPGTREKFESLLPDLKDKLVEKG